MLIVVLQRQPNSSWCVRAPLILTCKSYNPCCNDGKRVLQQGVKEQDAVDAGPPGVGKIRGLDPPHPPKTVAMAMTALLTLFGRRTNTTVIVILAMTAGVTENGASSANCYGSSLPPTNLKG